MSPGIPFRGGLRDRPPTPINWRDRPITPINWCDRPTTPNDLRDRPTTPNDLRDRPQSFMGWVAHLMPKMGGWVMADTPNPGIKMAGLKAHVPSRGRSQPQSSSEDFCYEPWNSIPGRFARSPDNPQRFARSPNNPQRFARWGDNLHQSMRWGDCPQPFMGWVAHLMPKMGGWVMANTPNPGIKMAGLKAHVPAGQFPQSSSEDFCYEPWNSIPGRFARSPANTHQLARSPDNPHQLVRSPNNPQRFARSPNNPQRFARSPSIIYGVGGASDAQNGWVGHGRYPESRH